MMVTRTRANVGAAVTAPVGVRRDDPRTWPERARKTVGRPKPVVVVDGTESQTAVATVVSRSKSIVLRTLVPADLEYVSAWADDPELDRLVGSEFLRAYKHAYDKHPSFYDAVLTDPTQVTLIVEGRTGFTVPVGFVRLYNVHLVEGYAYIETVIADARALRRGFGVQASRLMAYYGIDVLGLRRIESKVYAYNVLSINTLKRNACVQEGVLRKAAFKDGRYWDVIVFGVLKEELDALRRRDKYLLPEDRGRLDAS
jgi:RimJ/RimL family protein N-acetyltransferase